MGKPILCLDFDGVIHIYTSSWHGTNIVADGPVPGAIEFIYEAMEHFTIAVHSSRSKDPEGIAAMKGALKMWAIDMIETGIFRDDPMLCFLDCIEWPTEKPPAMVTLDDRAITFDGTWPSMDTLKEFKPWNKK